MALVQVIEMYADDIDEKVTGTSEDIRPIDFAIEGTLYRIYLGKVNGDKLMSALKRYRDKASEVTEDVVILPREEFDKLTEAASKTRRIAPRATDGSVVRNGGDREFTANARAWLIAQGHVLEARGRIPADKMALYEEHVKQLASGAQPSGTPATPTDTTVGTADTTDAK